MLVNSFCGVGKSQQFFFVFAHKIGAFFCKQLRFFLFFLLLFPSLLFIELSCETLLFISFIYTFSNTLNVDCCMQFQLIWLISSVCLSNGVLEEMLVCLCEGWISSACHSTAVFVYKDAEFSSWELFIVENQVMWVYGKTPNICRFT